MKISRLFLLMMVFVLDSPAQAQWSIVKKFIQKDVQIVETKKRLVLYRHALQDSLVLTMKEKKNSDIYGALDNRRGGNPFRIWVATEKFWNNPNRPKKMWGKFFRAEFLKTLRPPK